VAVTLDAIGQQYGLLPSEVLRRGSTFDLEVFDIARSYERMKSQGANGQLPTVSQADMETILQKVKA